MNKYLNSSTLLLLQPPPFDKTVESESISRIKNIISTLPENQRSVIILRDIEGFSYDEISDILDMNLGQVKVNLHRGRKQVRTQMTEIESYGLDELKILADKFWEGECSETEEKILRDQLRWNDSIPEELKTLKDYLAISSMPSEGLSLDFDEKVLSAISDKKPAGKSRLVKFLYPLAAAAVIAFGIFIASDVITDGPDGPNALEDTPVHVAEDTYETPEEAFDELKKALMMVSGNMNTGKKYSNELGKFSIAAESIQTKENKTK